MPNQKEIHVVETGYSSKDSSSQNIMTTHYKKRITYDVDWIIYFNMPQLSCTNPSSNEYSLVWNNRIK